MDHPSSREEYGECSSTIQCSSSTETDFESDIHEVIRVIPNGSWKEFVRVKLGVDDYNIVNIEADYKGLREQKYQMLLKTIKGESTNPHPSQNLHETNESSQNAAERYKVIDEVPDEIWKRFVRVKLKLKSNEIVDIEADHKGLREQKYQMLLKYQMSLKATRDFSPPNILKLADEFIAGNNKGVNPSNIVKLAEEFITEYNKGWSNDSKRLAREEAETRTFNSDLAQCDMFGPCEYITRNYCLQHHTNDGQKNELRLEDLVTKADEIAKIDAERYTTLPEPTDKWHVTAKNNIWLFGPAGCGKTWSSKQVVELAIEGSFPNNERKFDYVFYFGCESLEVEASCSLTEFITPAAHKVSKSLPNLMISLLDSDQVLFVFDAIDKISIRKLLCAEPNRAKPCDAQSGYAHLHNIIAGIVLQNAMKIWTCDTHSCQLIRESLRQSVVFEVLPFNDQQHEEVFSSKPYNKLEAAPPVKDLCRSPFFASIFCSTVGQSIDVDVERCFVSNMLCLGVEDSTNSLLEKLGTTAVLYRQLAILCKIAWIKTFEKDGNNKCYNLLTKLKEQVRKRFMSPSKGKGSSNFTNDLFQVFLASVHAMTVLDFKEFLNSVKMETMVTDEYSTMALCLFGMCDSTKQKISKFIKLQNTEVNNRIKTKETYNKKFKHLKEIAVRAAHKARVANGYDERIQALFRVGRWMQEANSEEMNSAVSSYLPRKVALADKIYPRDIGALSYLAKFHKIDLTLGIMSAPRFQNDAALLLFKSVAEEDNLNISSIDLRVFEVNPDVGNEMAKCISSVTTLRLNGAKIDEDTLNNIIERIASDYRSRNPENYENPENKIRLWIGHSLMPMSKKLTVSLTQAVKNLRELTLIVDDAPPDGLLGLIDAVSELDHKLELLDLGIPSLDNKLAIKLGKSSNKFRCLCLRGCEVAENSLSSMIEQFCSYDHKLRGFSLDHVRVTDHDIKILSECLWKFECWLVLMYCDVTKTGYEMLHHSHAQLSQNRYLQIFLGDVDGVGESVVIGK